MANLKNKASEDVSRIKFLRGGRLTKWKGKVASLSPSLGQLVSSVSSIALGRSLSIGANRTLAAAAWGGAGLLVSVGSVSAACLEDMVIPGVYTCSTTETTSQNLSATGTLLDVTINPGASFTTTAGDAFYLSGDAGITFLNNNATATITGDLSGIEANNTGPGALSITTASATKGESVYGINATNSGSSLSINAAETTGNSVGINANNLGSGALTIITTGTTAANTSSWSTGISANNNGTDLTITTSGSTRGGAGIVATNDGSGDLSITTALVTEGTKEGGIYATNYGQDLIVYSENVYGFGRAVFVSQEGLGLTDITMTGRVISTTSEGVYAYIGSGASNALIDTNYVSGGTQGIEANSWGDGGLHITTHGSTTGFNNEGIRAYVASSGTYLTIGTNGVTSGGTEGIFANNDGTGALTITTTSTTNGNAGSGIYANNSINGTGLSITTTNDTTGAASGVEAQNYGSGNLYINAGGTTTGNGVGNYGIYASNSPNGIDLLIVADTVTGDYQGIRAGNGGTGQLSITTTGTINGRYDTGIYAKNAFTGTDFTIVSAITTGAFYGIYARAKGVGDMSITTTGATTAYGKNAVSGIDVQNSNRGANLNITASATTGAVDGIWARQRGTDALTINVTGAIEGAERYGIYAWNEKGTSLTITNTPDNASNITGGAFGIYASNDGTGALSITASGVTSSQDTLGVDNAGIFAWNGTNSTGDLTITANETYGADLGISAKNDGSGILSITTTGRTTTSSDPTSYGIAAYATKYSSGLTIDAQYVKAGKIGIYADNRASGTLSITAHDRIEGTTGNGIEASNSSNGANLIITAVDTVGGLSGIYAINSGSGELDIRTSGNTVGGTGFGIYTNSPTGQAVQITLNSGSDVSATSGNAIVDTDADASVTVNTGASVTGSIALGGGVDTLTFAGGDFSGVTSFDGGDGASDILSFGGSSGALDSTIIYNWERVEITAGSTISFSNNLLAVNTLSIGTGGIFDATSGTFTLTGNLNNTGTLRLADGDVSDVVNVSGNFVGGGTISMDVNTAAQTSDTLDIAGDASGTTQIAFTNMTPTSGSDNIIADVVTVQGTSSAKNFSGSVVGGIYTYNLEYNAGSFDLVPTANSTSAAYKIAPTILGGFNQMSSLNQRMSQRQVGRVDVPTRLSFSALDPVEQEMPNLWLNIGGTRAQRVTSAGTDLEYTNRNIAFGADFELELGTSGRWVIGTHAQYGTQNGSVTDETGVSIASTTGIGAGISATWYGNSGTYVDTQAQMTQLKTEISSDAGGLLIEDAESKAYALSMEIGHRIELNGQSSLTPQAQLTFGKVNGASFTDTAGTIVDLGTSMTKTGRIGLTYEHQDAQFTFYSSGSILRDFGRPTTVEAAGQSFSEDTNATWGEISIGSSYMLSDVSRLYGQVGYRQALNSSSSNVLSANLGIQIQW